MPAVSLCFEVHQPFRVRRSLNFKGNFFSRYFDVSLTKHYFDRAAEKCYYPTTSLLLRLIDEFKKEKKPFKVAFSITGSWAEQAERWHPDLIDLFAQFPKRCVEFLAETYYHSLASLFMDKTEFKQQVEQHATLVKELFHYKPRVMTNTEMLYNNLIAKVALELGFKALFTEGVPWVLGWRSPNYVYQPPLHVAKGIKILLRNRRLTDDVGFRFSARWWDQWPLTADKYAAWLAACEGQCVNIFLDYETFGEHHWAETGIFEFLRALPYEVNKWENLRWALPSELVKQFKSVGEFDVFELATISWADLEMDTSAWLGNEVQRFVFNKLQALEEKVRKLNDHNLLEVWRHLQASDLLHHLCTKSMADGTVHAYFSCFDNPFQGFVALTNAVTDFAHQVERRLER